MEKILCSIDEIVLPGHHNNDVPSVMATCSRCRHTTESFGTSDNSKTRCLALMKEECPQGENNFYEEE